MKISSKICTLLLALAIPALSSADEAFSGRGGHREGMKFFKQLDLTAEQKTQLKDLRSNSKAERKALKQQLKEARKKMQVMQSSGASESEMRALHEQINENRKKMSDFRFEKMMKLRKVLTPDQLKKLQALRKDKRKSRGGRHQDRD